MVDDGVFPNRAPDEPDPVFESSDGAPLFPDDHIGGSLPEMVIDLGQSPVEGPERAPSSMEPELALPDDLWGEPGEGTGAVGELDLALGADTSVKDDLWRPGEVVDLDASALSPPVGGPAERRPALAAPTAPPGVGRWQAMRRSVEDLHLNRRVAAVGLAGITAAGLFATLAARSSEDDGPQRQVVSAGTRPVASVPASSVPVSATTTVASTLPAAAPGGAPTTVVPIGSPPPPTTAGQVAANRSPSPAESATTSPPRSTATASPPQSPPAPAAPPATRAPATVAEPEYEEPETPPTTRRPRVTVPPTTAVPDTTSSTTSVPPADD